MNCLERLNPHHGHGTARAGAPLMRTQPLRRVRRHGTCGTRPRADPPTEGSTASQGRFEGRIFRLRLRNYYGCAADLQNVIILSADDSSKDPLVAEQYCALVRLARIDKTDRVSGTGDPEIRRLEEETLGRICELNESHAVGLLNRGDAGDAIDYLLMAMMAAPESARLYGLRASAYVKRGDLAQAEADLTTAVRLDPTNPRFLRLRAELRRKRDDKDGAAEDEQAAKKLSRSGVNVSNMANKPKSASNVSTANSPSNEPTQWTPDSIIEIVQKSTTEPAKKTVKSTPKSAPKSTATLDTVNGSCDEPLSKMIRLSVEDVYSSSAGELLNLSELPINIRRILT
ncbi:unnamed protein product [Nesidiocoris tenuis]|uniref:Uncharacterized protein n=1 Tax=Nesidiocoris tenuis TaxID=355587 RepID=A0A6H5FXM1_9HEMI|nr:unnamed protein product [Nesidiocoris tenuis]